MYFDINFLSFFHKVTTGILVMDYYTICSVCMHVIVLDKEDLAIKNLVYICNVEF